MMDHCLPVGSGSKLYEGSFFVNKLNKVSATARIHVSWYPTNTPPPFATLALIQNAGGGGGGAYTRDATLWWNGSARMKPASTESLNIS